MSSGGVVASIGKLNSMHTLTKSPRRRLLLQSEHEERAATLQAEAARKRDAYRRRLDALEAATAAQQLSAEPAAAEPTAAEPATAQAARKIPIALDMQIAVERAAPNEHAPFPSPSPRMQVPAPWPSVDDSPSTPRPQPPSVAQQQMHSRALEEYYTAMTMLEEHDDDFFGECSICGCSDWLLCDCKCDGNHESAINWTTNFIVVHANVISVLPEIVQTRKSVLR